jgi:hypothetical protein
MFRVENFLGSMRVSRKLTASFVLVIGLMAAASAFGLVTTRSNLPILDRIVRVDAVLAGEGADLRSVLLEMRQHEKDLVLQVDSPAKIADNETKWNARHPRQGRDRRVRSRSAECDPHHPGRVRRRVSQADRRRARRRDHDVGRRVRGVRRGRRGGRSARRDDHQVL